MMTVRRSVIAALCAGAAALALATTPAEASVSYTGFQNVDYTTGTHADPNYTVALGLTNGGIVVGFSGAPSYDGKPSKGWLATAPYAQADFHEKNYPNSAQTQLVGINADNDLVGSYTNSSGVVSAFYRNSSSWTTVAHATQLMGINGNGKAVGWIKVPAGAQPVKCTIPTGGTPTCVHLALPGTPANAVATGINDHGDICGYIIASSGASVGFVLRADGTFWESTAVSPYGSRIYGIDQADQVVGYYLSSTNVAHGFVATSFSSTAQTVNDPSGVLTVLRAINNTGGIAGYYKDAAGHWHGFVAHS